MGAPELPGDPGEEDVNPTQVNVHHPPVHSDDSDYEMNAIDAYEGYQPLAMGDEPNDISAMNDDISVADHDASSSDETTLHAGTECENVCANGLTENLPKVESVDAEIERQVWSEPRPKELQLELDNTKTTQILNVMANITLPNAVVPAWAAGVPEEHWKEELLQRIRQREETGVSSSKETST